MIMSGRRYIVTCRQDRAAKRTRQVWEAPAPALLSQSLASLADEPPPSSLRQLPAAASAAGGGPQQRGPSTLSFFKWILTSKFSTVFYIALLSERMKGPGCLLWDSSPTVCVPGVDIVHGGRLCELLRLA